MPDVSVIIPAHNAGAYLREAVDSVRAERARGCSIELIVVDDRSTDGSTEALVSLAGTELTLAPSRGPGAAAARNTGLALATAPFVRFLDADDWLVPGALIAQIAHLRGLLPRHPKAASVGWYESFDQTSGRRRLVRQHPRLDGGASLLRRNVITGSVLHQRDELRASGGFDSGLPCIEEFELHFRLALAGVEFVEWRFPVFVQRVHPAPHRLSNRSFTGYGAEFWRTVTETQFQAASQRHPRGLPESLRRAFAYRWWELGRCLLREGDTASASRFFSRAREFHPGEIAGRLPYRILARLVGPFQAELARKP